MCLEYFKECLNINVLLLLSVGYEEDGYQEEGYEEDSRYCK